MLPDLWSLRWRRATLPAAALALAALSNCAGCPSGSGDDAGTSVTPSTEAVVRFKRDARLTTDLAQALALTPDTLCKELGLAQCAVVHAPAIGGTDPYQAGLYAPLPFTTVSSPLVVERIALAACRTRVDTDLAAGGNAVIFKLGVNAAGGLDVGSPELGAVVTELYQRLDQRAPTSAELAHYYQLYRDVAAAGSDRPGRDWAVLTCFAAATSMEALFY